MIAAFVFATLFNAKIWQIYFANEPMQGVLDIFPVLCFFLFLFLLMFALFSLFSFRGVQKLALSIFFLVSSASLYFSISFNILFDESMLQNVLETDVNEAADLLTGGFWLVLVLIGIVPTLVIFNLKINYQKLWKQASFNLALGLAGFVLSLASLYPFYGEFSSFIRNNNKQLSRSLLPSAPLYALYKNLVSVTKEQQITKQLVDAKAKVIPFNVHPKKPLALVVMIGETARASSFVLDDAEKLGTKLNLIERQDLVYFNNFWSCGTNTAMSLPCMFSIFSKDDYKREYNKQYENVAEILQRIGYLVSWRDNNSGCKGVCRSLNKIPVDTVDTEKFKNIGGFFDEVLVDDLAFQVKQNSTDQVIFLHQMGSHGPAYFKRVPKDLKKFQPACESSNFRDCTDEEIQNAYHNSVLYTKYTITTAISQLDSISGEYDTALIYLSDHGESTGEKGYYLHGIPYFMAPDEQTHIPALLWMSKGFAESKMIDTSCVKNKQNDRLSHDNLSHTLLGILDVESDIYQPELNIFSGCMLNP